MTEPLAYLMSLPRYAAEGFSAIKPGFERIERLLSGMGDPQKEFQTVLVAGTNGKGSTSSLLASMLTASGVRTGLHTSPHLVSVGERMRVDSVAAPPEWLAHALASHRELIEEVQPSFYEASLALSLLRFAQEQVRWSVVEVGLGGRLDASNFLDADLVIITSIAMDHAAILGSTLEQIALEKAGIIKQNRPVVTPKMPSDIQEVFSRVAYERRAPLHCAPDAVVLSNTDDGLASVESDFCNLSGVAMQLKGKHQLVNAAVALCTFSLMSEPFNSGHIRSALESTSRLSGIQARCQIVSQNPLLMVDVAHNPDAITASLATFLAWRRDSDAQAAIVLGLLSDKDSFSITSIVGRSNHRILTVGTVGERATSSQELSATFSSQGFTNVRACQSVAEALAIVQSQKSDCLVTGSHGIAAAALTLLQP